MKIISYTKTETLYRFITEDGDVLLYPISAIIIVDDESGARAVKTTASRKTIGLIIQ